jgi:hypothetical protein
MLAGGNVGIGDSDPSEAKLSITGVSAGDYAVKIEQDQAQVGLYIQQDGAHNALYIDSAATTSGEAIKIEAPTHTTANVFTIHDADDLTSGGFMYMNSNAPSDTARGLVYIINSNALSNNAVPLAVLNASVGSRCIEVEATNASYALNMLYLNAFGRSSNSGFEFIRTYTDGDNDIQHYLRGDGEAYADASWNASGADYAEYFESKDGSKMPVGTTVKLDGDKIVACESGDSPLGVVRPQGCSSNIGNAAGVKWQGKYLTDDYRSPIKEEYSVTSWIDGKDANGGDNDIQYHTDKIPSDVTVPDDATVLSTEKDGSKLMRKKLNPDFVENIGEDGFQIYLTREDRDEWHIVGLLGQIPITNGQPTGSSWIKMSDISVTASMWFVK